MKFLGVDCSTYTGLCLYDSEAEKSECRLLHYPKMSGMRRVQLIAGAFEQAMQDFKPDVAAVEGFAYGNKSSLVTLVELATPLKMCLFKAKIPWYEVPPLVLKKWLTGSGNAKKEQMAEQVLKLWGYAPRVAKGDDLVDAYALARIAEYLHCEPKKALLDKVSFYS